MATKAELLQKMQEHYNDVGEWEVMETAEKQFGMKIYRVPLMIVEGNVMRTVSPIVFVRNEGQEDEEAYMDREPRKENSLRSLIQQEIAERETLGVFVKGNIESVDEKNGYGIVGGFVRVDGVVTWKRYLMYDRNGIQYYEIDPLSTK